MALTHSVLYSTAHSNAPTNPYEYASNITTVDGSAVLIMFTSSYTSTYQTVSGFTSSAFDSATYIGRYTLWHTSEYTVEWWWAQGNGGTGKVSVSLSGTAGVGETGLLIVEASDAGNTVSVVQSKTASATNSTASVTLDGSVDAAAECVYLATWDDQTDTGTPGSGWTEAIDEAAPISTIRHYSQYHTNPSGAQNGAVTLSSSQQNASMIAEVLSAGGGGGGSSFTGWGIPIN